jgi:hypothetical protein
LPVPGFEYTTKGLFTLAKFVEKTPKKASLEFLEWASLGDIEKIG